MGLGVAAIALSVVCLIASFAFPVPSWVNLLGIGFGVVGLLLIGKGRKGGGGGA
ncbi:MAG: hypothetical protein AAFW87_05765 [Pseudomonadota bacterium]